MTRSWPTPSRAAMADIRVWEPDPDPVRVLQDHMRAIRDAWIAASNQHLRELLAEQRERWRITNDPLGDWSGVYSSTGWPAPPCFTPPRPIDRYLAAVGVSATSPETLHRPPVDPTQIRGDDQMGWSWSVHHPRGWQTSTRWYRQHPLDTSVRVARYDSEWQEIRYERPSSAPWVRYSSRPAPRVLPPQLLTLTP